MSDEKKAPEKTISEITEALKGTLPILRSHLGGSAGDASRAMVEIDQAIAPVRKSVYEDYSRPIATAFDQVTGSMNNWLSQSGKAQPEDRKRYAAGIDALARKIENFQTVAEIALRDEERRAKTA